MASKPCPFCPALATYTLRAKAADRTFSPGRYCQMCDTVFSVRGENGDPEELSSVLAVPLRPDEEAAEAVRGPTARRYLGG
jgi:hypothetical protein